MNKRLWYFLLFTIVLATFISPFASGSPDGLEKVAIDLGFIELEKEPLFEVIPDYSVPFITIDYLSTALSGFVGLVIIGLLFGGNWWLFKRMKS